MSNATMTINGRTFIPWNLIDPDPDQPRKTFDAGALNELAASFGAGPEGIHTDLLVREHPKSKGRYMLVAGERRWRAAELANFDRVPCRVAGAEEVANARLIQLTENMQRANMTALEEAVGAQKLLEERRQANPKYSVEELGKELGKGRAATYELLSLLKLSKPVHTALVKGEINPSMAARIAAVPVPEAQADCLAWISNQMRQAVSVRELQGYIAANHCKSLDDASFPLDQVFEGKRIVAFSCDDCPHRSGNQPNWPDGKNKLTCLRPECYRAKALAHAVANGKEAIEPKRFDVNRADYVTPNERVYTHSKGYIEAKKVINPKQPPKTYVTTDSVGDLLEVWLRKEWQASAESDGVQVDKPKAAKPAPAPKKPKQEMSEAERKKFIEEQMAAEKQRQKELAAQQKQQREREERAAAEQLREKVAAAVLPELREKLGKPTNEKAVLLAVLKMDCLEDLTRDALCARRMKLAELEKCDAGELRSILWEANFRVNNNDCWTTGDDYTAEFVTACKLVGIDLKAEEKKLAPKEEKTGELFPPAKASAKKKGPKKK